MPTMLLVEDKQNVLEVHRRSFEEMGAYVITATNAEDAVKLFRRHAGIISGVVTDLRLVDDTDEGDVSGALIAKEVKTREPDLPTVCVSAFDLTAKFKDSPFDLYYRKGVASPELDILENIPGIISRFDLYAQHRYSRAPKELLAIRDRYKITDDDFLKLISALPISTHMQIPLLRIHEYAAGVVGEDGGASINKIMVIEPSSEIGASLQLRQALPVVVRRTAVEEHVAELYGIPAVYAYGASEAAAIEGLIESLLFYKEDLKDNRQAAPEREILRFQRFLQEIFDA